MSTLLSCRSYAGPHHWAQRDPRWPASPVHNICLQATLVGMVPNANARGGRNVLMQIHAQTDARCKQFTPVPELQGTMSGKCKVAIPRSAAASLEALINSTLNYHLPGPPAPPAARPPPPLPAPPGPPLGVVAVGRLPQQQQQLAAPCGPPPPPGLCLMTLPLLPLLPDFDMPPLPLDEGITPEEMAALGF